MSPIKRYVASGLIVLCFFCATPHQVAAYRAKGLDHAALGKVSAPASDGRTSKMVLGQMISPQNAIIEDASTCYAKIAEFGDVVKSYCSDVSCENAFDSLLKGETDGIQILVDLAERNTGGKQPLFWTGFAGPEILPDGKGSWNDLEKYADDLSSWTDYQLFPAKNAAWDEMYDSCYRVQDDEVQHAQQKLEAAWTELVTMVASKAIKETISRDDIGIGVVINGDQERFTEGYFLKVEIVDLKKMTEATNILLKVYYTKNAPWVSYGKEKMKSVFDEVISREDDKEKRAELSDVFSNIKMSFRAMTSCLDKYLDERSTYMNIIYVALGLTLLNVVIIRASARVAGKMTLAGFEAFMAVLKFTMAALLLGPFAVTCPSGCECGVIGFQDFYPYILLLIGALWVLRGWMFFRQHQQQPAGAVGGQGISLIT